MAGDTGLVAMEHLQKMTSQMSDNLQILYYFAKIKETKLNLQNCETWQGSEMCHHTAA